LTSIKSPLLKQKKTSLRTKTLLFEQVSTGLDTALSYGKSRYRFCGAEVFSEKLF